MNTNFRTLKANEIECRIGSISKEGTGLSLLLYKDARCDMTLLDSTVGAMNWKREHSRDNANCTVSIWDSDKNEWVSKEDTGTESNTEAAKGLASDSFKRACVNWGIGRELYTAPFIWISADKCKIVNNKCYDKFDVVSIEYNEGREITALTIKNEKTGETVYTLNRPEPKIHDALFRCTRCDKQIRPYKDANGKDIGIRQHCEGSQKKFGSVLCLDCIKELQK